MAVAFAHLDRAALDAELSPSRAAKDPWGVLARHERVTSALASTAGLTVVPDVPYGAAPRQRLDFFVPASTGPHPCLIWFHGGFWQEGSKAGSGFAAAPLAAAGWAMAGVGYTLTPEVRLREVVAAAAAAVTHVRETCAAHGLDASRLVVGGHSAGAHLAAALLAGIGGPAATMAIAGAVLVSGVYDLAPVAASYVNERAHIDADEVRDLSPLCVMPARDVPVHLVIGADEPDQFQRQTDALATAWRPQLSRLSTARAPGRDHFDVLDELADPASASFHALLEMAS